MRKARRLIPFLWRWECRRRIKRCKTRSRNAGTYSLVYGVTAVTRFYLSGRLISESERQEAPAMRDKLCRRVRRLWQAEERYHRILRGRSPWRGRS